jgi:SAM-dependent methyltransferase
MDATHGAAAGGGEPVVWETTPCPLCGVSDETERLLAPGETDGQVYRLAQCRRCDMVYLNPRPNRATIGHYYADNYEPYQAPKRDGDGPFGLWRRLRRLVCAQAFGDPPPLTRRSDKLIAAIAAPVFHPGRDSLTALSFHGAGRLLDFGCGSGWYAKRMSDRGWTVTAMDFNPHTAEQVARRYGLRTLSGTLPHPEVEDASFDVVVMGASLEHVHCPHEVVGASVRALAPGGRYVAVVPNLAAAAFRWFGVDWWPLDPPRHLLHFTPATMRRLMAMHGLEVEEVRAIPHGSWMRRTLANCRRRRGLTALSKMRIAASLLTRWTDWVGQGDGLRVIARRPETARLKAAA